jgi:hypothetical protein
VLVVNGKPYEGSAMLFGNGAHKTDSHYGEPLPPGRCMKFGYQLGVLFKTPGTYTISWKGEGFESSPVVFRVIDRTPNRPSTTAPAAP